MWVMVWGYGCRVMVRINIMARDLGVVAEVRIRENFKSDRHEINHYVMV
jgi:hypothetical protein